MQDNKGAQTRIYSYKEGVELREYYLKLLKWYRYERKKGNGKKRGKIPLIPEFIYRRFVEKHGFKDTKDARKKLSKKMSTDPGWLDMAHFANDTTFLASLQQNVGACVSYYIYALVEAFLFSVTTEDQRTNIEQYGEWINQLIQMYELLAFQVAFKKKGEDGTRDKVPSNMADIWKAVANTPELQELRKDISSKCSPSKDNIPEKKFWAFTMFLPRLNEIGWLDSLPDDVRDKLIAIYPGTKKIVKKNKKKVVEFSFSPALRDIKKRANMTVASTDSLGELRKWVGRNMCRTQFILVLITCAMVRNHEEVTKDSVRKKLEGESGLAFNCRTPIIKLFTPGVENTIP